MQMKPLNQQVFVCNPSGAFFYRYWSLNCLGTYNNFFFMQLQWCRIILLKVIAQQNLKIYSLLSVSLNKQDRKYKIWNKLSEGRCRVITGKGTPPYWKPKRPQFVSSSVPLDVLYLFYLNSSIIYLCDPHCKVVNTYSLSNTHNNVVLPTY